MTNINIIEDAKGDLVEIEYYCSDYCAKSSEHYAGWYGCVELYTQQYCQNCGKTLNFVEDSR
jgi:hypothetical protein